MTEVAGTNPSGMGQASPWPKAWQLALFYALCLLGAGYAKLLATIPGTGISIWLPSGLLMGALVVNRRRTWVLWIAVASLAELTGNLLWFGNSLPVALLLIVGNAAESVVGAYLIHRLVGRPFQLETIRDVLGLVALGAVLAPLVAAAIGGLTLMWSEGQPFASLLLAVLDRRRDRSADRGARRCCAASPPGAAARGRRSPTGRKRQGSRWGPCWSPQRR